MPWVYDDGGRAEAGYKGHGAGACVTRAIDISTVEPYQYVYDTLNHAARHERPRPGRPRSSARTGVHTPTIKRYMKDYGWHWVPAMGIGTGCILHLAEGELSADFPMVVSLSKHYVAVVGGVVHDLSDPARDGTRCVYGWYEPPGIWSSVL
jgi:hypothetical protein